jgi:hypothetical protein
MASQRDFVSSVEKKDWGGQVNIKNENNEYKNFGNR